MLLDEVVHYELRRETLPTAQLMLPTPGPSTFRIPRTLTKPKAARTQHTHYYYPSPLTPSSIALPGAAFGPTRIPSDASDSPVQSPSSSSSSRKLLKTRQGCTSPLVNPSFYPFLSSPAPRASAPTSNPVSPPIPPQIPQIQTRLSGLPDERVRNATQFGSLERPRPRPTLPSGTPTVEIPSDPRRIGVDPPLMPRYSNVKNKRWALWSEWCYFTHSPSKYLTEGGSRVALYLLFGVGNLILALRMRRTFPKWSLTEHNTGTPATKRTGQPLSRPPRELMDLWKIAPLVNVLVTCGLLAI